MSQSRVTSFYVTRRTTRNQSGKICATEPTKNIALAKDAIVKSVPQEVSHEVQEKSKAPSKTKAASVENKVRKSKPQEAKQKTAKRGPKVSKKALASQSKVTSFYGTQTALKEPSLNTITEDIHQSPISDPVPSIASSQETCTERIETVKTFPDKKDCKEKELSKKGAELIVSDQDKLRSPKRNLTNANEGTPPKKKSLLLSSGVDPEKLLSPSKFMTPKKLFNDDRIESKSNEISPAKKEIIIPNRSEETKKAIANFKAKLALVRNYEANSFKTTSIISPTQRLEKKSAIPTVPAYQRFSYLADPELSSSLILPFKYKLLAEMFRSMDTVVSILNNRKEKITLDKVKDGVQQMMKRTFSKNNLGQIMTVMPAAYEVNLEKCAFKKASDPDYQLIITPKLNSIEGSSKKSKSNQFVIMSPQDLSERKEGFHNLLLNLVKQHHQVFLSRLNFPSVPAEKIKRWHPKFAVDSVPDIEVATLPEIPESKVYTAKDVLNKVVKASFCGKVVKALKSVAEESANADKKIELEPSPSQKTPAPTKSALKGVCTDLIAKIRARESAKHLESMIESPDETKRKAMLERLPKIIQILWHYFIAERKAAVPIDTAVDKIIHSCSSLSTHEEVKAHLNLITETFPGWLSFIQIPKGLYITINKNKNITEMLDKIQH